MRAQLNVVPANASGSVATILARSSTSLAPDDSTKLSSGSLKSAACSAINAGGGANVGGVAGAREDDTDVGKIGGERGHDDGVRMVFRLPIIQE